MQKKNSAEDFFFVKILNIVCCGVFLKQKIGTIDV